MRQAGRAGVSLILDALNKSRNDTQDVPGLGTEHYREAPAKPWLRYLPWAGLAMALALVAWLLATGRGEPEEDIVAPVAELSRNIGSAATSVTDELKARAEQARQERATQAPVATAAPPGQNATPAAPPQPAAGVAPAPPPAAALESDAVRALYEKRRAAGEALLERARRAKGEAAPAAPATSAAPVVPAAPAQEQAIDVEQVLRQAQQEVANAGLVEHPAPFLVDLSQQTKNAIPTILYQRHDYSSQGGRSSVTLNGKTVRVGGSPAAGLKVDEILEDSVILDYRGTQFRLRALNSWVNL